MNINPNYHLFAYVDKDIARIEGTLSIVPNQDPNKYLYLNDLGLAYRKRFEMNRDVRDMDKSIAAFKQAVYLLPQESPYRAPTMCRLAQSYMLRDECLGRVQVPTAPLGMPVPNSQPQTNTIPAQNLCPHGNLLPEEDDDMCCHHHCHHHHSDDDEEQDWEDLSESGDDDGAHDQSNATPTPPPEDAYTRAIRKVHENTMLTEQQRKVALCGIEGLNAWVKLLQLMGLWESSRETVHQIIRADEDEFQAKFLPEEAKCPL